MATSEDNRYDDVRIAMETQIQDKWLHLQNKCTELQEKRTTQAVDTDLTPLFRAKENLLKSQIHQLENCNDSFPTEKVVHRELLLQELTKSVEQLEESKTLSHTLYTEAVAELDKEKRINKQHKSIKATLQEKLADTGSPAVQDNNTILAENTEKLKALQKHSQSLLTSMGAFMKKNFPLLNQTEKRRSLKKRGMSVDGDEEIVPFESLQSILEVLMNTCVDTPHDPYIQLDPALHWPPYVQLLIRCGIAIRHPDDEARIKLTPFHL